MPENYVMLFDLEADEVNRRIIGESTREIEQISTYIKNKETSPVETFSEDFYDEVSDGQLSFSDEELYNKDTDKNE